MKQQIEKYINNIDYKNYYDYVKDCLFDDWYFRGDGEGDFEETANKATKDTVESYIEYCEKQIELAKKYLEEIC